MTQPTIITVGGGKGGVGKSFIAANAGTLLAGAGHQVGFVDCDLGGANLHQFLGVRRPEKGLQDFLTGRAKALADVTLQTLVPNSWLVSGVGEGVRLTNPTFLQKQRLISHIAKMQADVILVDLGAGTHFDISDFFSAFRYSIVVSDSLPTSVENAYAYLKNGIVRGLCHLARGNKDLQRLVRECSSPAEAAGAATIRELLHSLEPRFGDETRLMAQWLHQRKTYLVLNMVREQEDIAVGQRFVDIVKRYLSIDMFYIGYVIHSPEVRRSIKASRPAVLSVEPSPLRDCFAAICRNLATMTGMP
jgi:flagellar biosynthesis protein FlhG